MWNRTNSLRLSIILVWTLLVLILVLALCVPLMVHWYEITYPYGMGLLTSPLYIPMCTCLYLAAALGEICLYHLLRLLYNLKHDIVFVAKNCHHLRIISWCCLLVSIPFAAFVFWRVVSFIIALAALFFGLILRVLKNVFDKAVELQEENDYTV